jgi:hypothetical protein
MDSRSFSWASRSLVLLTTSKWDVGEVALDVNTRRRAMRMEFEGWWLRQALPRNFLLWNYFIQSRRLTCRLAVLPILENMSVIAPAIRISVQLHQAELRVRGIFPPYDVGTAAALAATARRASMKDPEGAEVRALRMETKDVLLGLGWRPIPYRHLAIWQDRLM